MHFKKHILGLAVAILPIFSFAQIHSYETWTEASVSTEIINDVDFSFVTEARMFNEYFQLKSISGDIGIDYKISKNLKCGVGHKLTQKNLEQGFFPTNTSSVNLQYKYKIKKCVNERIFLK